MKISPPIRSLAPRLLIIPPVLAGVLFVALAVRKDKAPAKKPLAEAQRTLRVIRVAKTPVTIRALGFGIAQPGEIWRAVPQVQGRVVEVHPELKSGAIIQQGALLLRIDATEYELAVARLEAEVDQAQAAREELEATRENLEASLEIERESLRFAESELERLTGLRAQNAASQSALEEFQRNVLAQRQALQSIENSLHLIPAELKSAAALVEVKKSSLAQARLDVEKTTIKAPFNCRVSQVNLESGQYVAAGQELFEVHSLDVIEVVAQAATHHLKNLIRFRVGDALRPPTMESLREVFAITATVRFQSGDFVVEWPAQFRRVRENVDQQTRTLGVVVAIDKPYENAIPGIRPPPFPGAYCEVELRSQDQLEYVLAPRSAIRDGAAFVLDGQNRLHRREVQIAFAQSSFVCIESGLTAGETLVVSDPSPAVEGMLVEPVFDEQLSERLLSEASGAEDMQ